MILHLEARDHDGEWCVACGAHTQQVTGRLADVDCKRCLRSRAFQEADAGPHKSEEP